LQDSVCLDTDVAVVVEEVFNLWKKGILPNLLLVLDFVIMSILKQEGQKVPRSNEISNVTNL
jgi:hypothetical protein